MLAWSPILVQKIEIHALGFVLRKLQLNRHRETEVAPHRHEHAQLILYLTGEGVQTVGRRRRNARSGDLFVIPAGLPHGFALQGGSRPLCLVLDYDVEDSGRVRSAHRRLPPDTLNELHTLLARLPAKRDAVLHWFRGDELMSAPIRPSAPPQDTWTLTLADVKGDKLRRRKEWLGA